MLLTVNMISVHFGGKMLGDVGRHVLGVSGVEVPLLATSESAVLRLQQFCWVRGENLEQPGLE